MFLNGEKFGWIVCRAAASSNNPIHADSGHTYSQLMDMNGDGLPDKVAHKNWETGAAGFYVGLNNGAGFDAPQNWITSFVSGETWQNNPIHTDSGQTHSQLTDMNGDGLPDKVAHKNWETGADGFYVGLNNGHGFGLPCQWRSPLGPTSNYSVCSNTEDVRYLAKYYKYDFSAFASANFTNASIMDINGDGLPDRIQSNDWENSASGLYIGLNTSQQPVITSIANSMDLTTTVEYKPLSDTTEIGRAHV